MVKTYHARPEAAERLATLAGTERGHVRWTHARLPSSAGSLEWVRKVLTARVPAPRSLMVELIRVLEDAPGLTRDEAWERREAWFSADGGREEP